MKSTNAKKKKKKMNKKMKNREEFSLIQIVSSEIIIFVIAVFCFITCIYGLCKDNL